MKGEAVEPTFGVLERAKDAGPCERLVACRVAACKAVEGMGSFGWGEKFGGQGVVGNHEVSACGNDDCEKPFQDENPAPAVKAADAFHERYTLGSL